jgi:hypothetical protein
MRKLIILVIFLSLTAGVFAQTPQKMSYQAVIRNNSGLLVASTKIGMEINIRQGSTSGTIVYTETQTPTTNVNGLVNIEIGEGTGFNTINWANNVYFIETKTAVTEPLTNYTITGVSQLLSVPYALNAKTAESITGTITETDPIYAASEAAKITSEDVTKLSNLSGVNTGDQDGSETKVTAGTNVTITGNGTTVSPYVINAIANVTEAERDTLSPVAGSMIFNTTSNKPNYYNGIEWMNYDGTSAQSIVLGGRYHGGIVSYIFQVTDPGYVAGETHGLIVSVSDLGTCTWNEGTYFPLTGATATALGTGLNNTNLIITAQGITGSYAAKRCRDYTGGGYSDWYLPSKDELNKLYLNKDIIGNFIIASYWSSTETGSSFAIVQNFKLGTQGSGQKHLTNYYFARAVRTF